MARKVELNSRTFYEPALRWKSGRAYIRFYNPNKRPRQREQALHTSDERTAEILFHERRFEFLNAAYDPWTEKRLKGVTLETAIEAYLDDPYLRESTIKCKWWRLMPFAKLHPGMLVQGVTLEMIKKCYQRKSLQPDTQLRYLYEFRRFLRFCKKKGWIIENPAADIIDDLPRHMKQEKRRVTEFLTPEDIGHLLRVIDEDVKAKPHRKVRLFMKDVIVFAASTGLRRSEICNLRWRDVNLFVPPKTYGSGTAAYGWISVRGDGHVLTKTGDEDRVPLVSMSYEILLRLRQNADQIGYVFESPRGKRKLDRDWITGLFREYRILAGLPDEITFHSLRHTCASWLAQNGADLKLIQEVLRHSNIRQTMRYTHMIPEVVAEKAVKAMEKIKF